MKLKQDSPVHIVAILDRSGSMTSLVDASIEGFNSFLTQQQELPGEAKLSVVLFDDKYEILYDDVDIKEAKPLTRDTFVPRGMTALYDAIGITLTRALKLSPERAIICILTDGAENSSKEFNSDTSAALIKQARDKGWEVTFLAANQDAFAVGSSLNISRAMTKGFVANYTGTMDSYNYTSALVSNYRSNT